MRDTTIQNQTKTLFEDCTNTRYQNRSLYHYSRGEIIVLEPQTLWYVIQGVVKLTTLSEKGEEVLVGMVGKSMVFGSGLTALPVYQATALSQVELVAMLLKEVKQSAQLTEVMFAAMTQRLRQMENFLAIHGAIRVEERFKQLLLLLLQDFGQPGSTGTRLEIRLTHQDFASACCTTRVTITRLINKLQQEQKLELDAQNHLIVKAPMF